MKITSLDKLEDGQTCLVTKININGEIKNRLLDMGIVENTKIKMIKKAPLGDPIQIYLRGYNLSLRKNIARKIEIEVIL